MLHPTNIAWLSAFAALLFAASASAQQTRTLTLRPPYTHFKAQSASGSLYRIDGVQADGSGGIVRVSYLGQDQCAGHVQRAAFKWTILPNVSSIGVTDGQRAFTVYLAIDADYDTCMQVNPMYVINMTSDALGRSPGGEARFYAFQHPFHVGEPRVFTYHAGLGEDNAGFSVDIALPSLPNHGGDQYTVEYRFNVSSGLPPPTAQLQIYNSPTVYGMRIDRCYRWATGCDKEAADAFCRSQGHFAAQDWSWEYAGPTRTLGDGLVCNDPSRCGAFKQIRCVHSPIR